VKDGVRTEKFHPHDAVQFLRTSPVFDFLEITLQDSCRSLAGKDLKVVLWEIIIPKKLAWLCSSACAFI